MSQNLIELRNQKNTLLSQAQAVLLNKEGSTKEERESKAKKMLDDVDSIEQSIAIEERMSKHAEEERAANRPPRGPITGLSNDGAENIEIRRDAQRKALRDYIVHGKEMEQRDLGTVTGGSITGGSQIIAPTFIPEITSALQSVGGLLNIVSQRTTATGNSMKVSLNDDRSNALTTWTEGSAITDSDPTLSNVTSTTTMYSTSITVTLEELEDAFFDLSSFITDLFGSRLGRGLSTFLSQGDSSGAFVNYSTGAVSGATSASGLSIGWADVAQLWNSVDPLYEANGVFVMNQNTRGLLLQQVDGMNRPLFVPAPSSDAFDTLIGRRVVLDPHLPNVALSSKSLYFGDFATFITHRSVASGFQIARDPYTYFRTKGSIAFTGYARGGSYLKSVGNPVKFLTQKSS